MTMYYPWQSDLWQQYVYLRQQQRLPHALLITGAAGLAKNHFSHMLAKSVLCFSVNDQDQGCGSCHSCQLFEAGSHPDHLAVEPEEAGKQIKIEQIRKLIDKQQLTPTVSTWKTIIISPAYSMNVNANNSLLKVLEEPPKNTLILLVSSKPDIMPITVKSRCQQLHMKIPTTEKAIDWIAQNSAHDINATTEKILRLARGAPIAAVEMLDANSAEQYQKIDNDFEQILNSTVNPVKLTASWQHYDNLQIIHQLQYNIFDRITGDQTQQSDKNEINKLPYWQILDCILETTRLLSTQNNLNARSLLNNAIVTIMQLANTPSDHIEPLINKL